MTDLLERPSPADAPRIDPRFARRWIDARREEGRRRLRLLVAAGATVAAAGLATGSLFTPLFEVRHVRIAVDGPLSAAAVGRLAGVRTGTLTIDVHSGSVAARLDDDPWLGAAQVSRHWPGTVDISVVVRSPLAVVAIPAGTAATGATAAAVPGGPAGTGGAPQGWAEVDSTGRVLTDLPTPPPGLTVLQGVSSVPAPGGWLTGTAGPRVPPGAAPSRLVDMTAASDGSDLPGPPAAALAVLDALPPLIRADVLSFSTAPGAGLSMVVSPPRMAAGTVTVLLGDGSQLQSKVTALLTILGQGNLAGVAGLDLSVPGRPATAPSVGDLSPRPSGPSPAAGSSGPAGSASGASTVPVTTAGSPPGAGGPSPASGPGPTGPASGPAGSPSSGTSTPSTTSGAAGTPSRP